jgi:steroid delta-isomerase-like uncharacterized protein
MASPATNRDVVSRFFAELWNQGFLEAAEQLIASNHVHHVASQDFHGPAGVRTLVTRVRTAFPDLKIEVVDVVESNDAVCVRWAATGTHLGPLGDFAPTGRRVSWGGLDLIRLRGGRIVELWGYNDALSVRDQLEQASHSDDEQR